MQPISLVVLDGEDTSEHVCIAFRCLFASMRVPSPRSDQILTCLCFPWLHLVNIALSYLLDRAPGPNPGRIPERSWKSALWLLGFSAIIFRVELFLLWVPISLQLLLQGEASFFSILTTNFAAAVAAAGEDESFQFVVRDGNRRLMTIQRQPLLSTLISGSENSYLSSRRSYSTLYKHKALSGV
jgi:hypothetical protein